MALLCFPRINNGKAVKVFLFSLCVCVCVSQQQQWKPQSFVSLRNIFFRRWSNQNSSVITTKIRDLSFKLKLPSSKALLRCQEQLFLWHDVDAKIRWTDLDEWLCSTKQMCLPIYCWHFPTFASNITQWATLYSSYLVNWPQTSLSEGKASTYLSALYNLFYDYPAVCCKKHINANNLFLTEMAISKPLIWNPSDMNQTS